MPKVNLALKHSTQPVSGSKVQDRRSRKSLVFPGAWPYIRAAVEKTAGRQRVSRSLCKPHQGKAVWSTHPRKRPGFKEHRARAERPVLPAQGPDFKGNSVPVEACDFNRDTWKLLLWPLLQMRRLLCPLTKVLALLVRKWIRWVGRQADLAKGHREVALFLFIPLLSTTWISGLWDFEGPQFSGFRSERVPFFKQNPRRS